MNPLTRKLVLGAGIGLVIAIMIFVYEIVQQVNLLPRP